MTESMTLLLVLHFYVYVLSSAEIHIKVYLYKIFVLYCFNPTIKLT